MAQSLGLLTPENVATLTHISDTLALDMRTLRYMTIVAQTPADWRFNDKEGRIWDPIPVPEEPEVEEEHDVGHGEPNIGETTFAAGGPQHDEFMCFMDNLDAADAAAIPTVPQMWNRFVQFETTQTAMRSDIELQRQRMDAFSLEQERQGSCSHPFRMRHREGLTGCSHPIRLLLPTITTSCLPPPPFTYASFGTDPGQKRSHPDEPSGSGANRED